MINCVSWFSIQNTTQPNMWSPVEVDQLSQLAREYTQEKKRVPWKQVSRRLGKTPNQCKQKWKKISRQEKWSESDQATLSYFCKEYQDQDIDWHKVSAHFSSYTARQCQCKWKQLLRRKASAAVKRVRWTLAEDQVLCNDGPQTCATIYPHRSLSSCRKRYLRLFA